MPILNERRKFVRYMLPYGMIYVFDHYSTKVGWVRDIGMGGLSFDIKHEGDMETISTVIDIFSYDPELFYISSVTCEKAFLLASKDKHSLNSNLRRIRCGQQFVSLTAEQKTRWRALIGKLSKYSDLFATVYNPFASV